MDTIYDLSAESNDGEQIDFSIFRGQPMLMVNTASRCRLPRQDERLQALHERHGPGGSS